MLYDHAVSTRPMSGYWTRIFEADIQLPVGAFGRSTRPDHVATDPESPKILEAIVDGLQRLGISISIPENWKPIPGYGAVLKLEKRTLHLTVGIVSEHSEYNRFRVCARLSPAAAREDATGNDDMIAIMKSALRDKLLSAVSAAGGRATVGDIELEEARQRHSFLKL